MSPSQETLKAVFLLKILRVALQWPQTKMSSELGISQSALARLERLDANVSLNILSKIIRLSKSHGVECDIFSDDPFTISFPDSILLSQWQGEALTNGSPDSSSE